jgi:general secretion pathway protein H
MFIAGTKEIREQRMAEKLSARDGLDQEMSTRPSAFQGGFRISRNQRTPRTVTQRARNKGFQNQAAFSLIELLVVLMLLALMTAVVIPSLGRVLSTAKLKTSSREIAASIRLARSKAVSEQQVYLLGFDLEKNEVKLSSLNSTYRKSFELPDGVHLVKVSLLETQVEQETKDPFFYFMPNGNSQSFQVSLRNEQGRALRVIHNNLKGTPIVDDDSTSQSGPSN